MFFFNVFLKCFKIISLIQQKFIFYLDSHKLPFLYFQIYFVQMKQIRSLLKDKRFRPFHQIMMTQKASLTLKKLLLLYTANKGPVTIISTDFQDLFLMLKLQLHHLLRANQIVNLIMF